MRKVRSASGGARVYAKPADNLGLTEVTDNPSRKKVPGVLVRPPDDTSIC